jgi:hypothetical protein
MSNRRARPHSLIVRFPVSVSFARARPGSLDGYHLIIRWTPVVTSSSHHLIISSSHHLIISSSHHLIISSSHHLIISSSHHLISSSLWSKSLRLSQSRFCPACMHDVSIDVPARLSLIHTHTHTHTHLTDAHRRTERCTYDRELEAGIHLLSHTTSTNIYSKKNGIFSI